MRWSLPLCLTLCVVPHALAACKTADASGTPATSSAPHRVVTTRAALTDVPKVLTYVATLDCAREATLATTGGGHLDALTVELGAPVSRGQILARMRDGEARATSLSASAVLAQAEARTSSASHGDPPQIRAAQIALDTARDNRSRVELLANQGSASAQELLRARADETTANAHLEAARQVEKGANAATRQARAQLEQSLVVLDERKLRAPFDGIVTTVFAKSGDFLMPGAAVAKVVDPASLRIVFEVPQHEIALIAKDAAIRLDGGELVARVSHLAAGLSGDARTRRTEARAVPEVASRPELVPGAKLRISVDRGESVRVAQVPSSSVAKLGGVARVFVLVGSRLEERVVSIERTVGKSLYVREGLREGDAVVLDPPGDLRDGDEARSAEGTP